jgi:YbbR domain-containing protein
MNVPSIFKVNPTAWLREAFTQDLSLKALSFACALLVYALVHGVQEAQRSFSVDLVILTPADAANRILTSSLPPRVRVTVHGPKNVLDDLHSDDLGTFQVSLGNGTASRVQLQADMVHLPTGVKIDQIEPPYIDLTWEERITRDIPVQVSVSGTPAPGYVVKGALDPFPNVVRATGPRNAVNTLQHARVESLDVSGLTEGKYSKSLRLDNPPGRVEFGTQIITVNAEIAREVGERPFPKVHISITGQTKAKSTPAEVDVRLQCPPEIIRSLRPEQVLALVNVDSKEPQGSVALPVVVKVDRCEASVSPPEVVIRW